MSPFAATEFFTFARTWELFSEEEPVWMALHRMEEFFDRQIYRREVELPSHVFLEHPETISIGEGTILEPGVYIQGPCILGKGCHVRHGAFLRGGVVCGERCVIGHSSELKKAILLDGAQVAHLNYVGDSIIGHRVNLGAGVKCANLRLDRKEISFFHEGEKVRTGLKKFGCVIGDHCQIGCNSVLNPGTLIGPRSISYPLLHLQGIIPARTRVKAKNSELEFASAEVSILESLRQP